MKSKMKKDLSITMGSENDLEKHIIGLGNLIKKDSLSVEKTIEEMSLSELVYCKTTLLFLVKMFKDKIGFTPTVNVGE